MILDTNIRPPYEHTPTCKHTYIYTHVKMEKGKNRMIKKLKLRKKILDSLRRKQDLEDR